MVVNILVKFVPGKSVVEDTHPPHIEAVDVDTDSIDSIAQSVKKAIRRRIELSSHVPFPSRALVYFSIEWSTPSALSPALINTMSTPELYNQIDMIRKRSFQDIMVVDYVTSEYTSPVHSYDRRGGVWLDLSASGGTPTRMERIESYDGAANPENSAPVEPGGAWGGGFQNNSGMEIDYNDNKGEESYGEEQVGNKNEGEQEELADDDMQDENGKGEMQNAWIGWGDRDDWHARPQHGNDKDGWYGLTSSPQNGNDKYGQDGWHSQPQNGNDSGWPNGSALASDDAGVEADDEWKSKQSDTISASVVRKSNKDRNNRWAPYVNSPPAPTPGSVVRNSSTSPGQGTKKLQYVLCEVEEVRDKSGTEDDDADADEPQLEAVDVPELVADSWGTPNNGWGDSPATRDQKQQQKQPSRSSSAETDRAKKAAQQSARPASRIQTSGNKNKNNNQKRTSPTIGVDAERQSVASNNAYANSVASHVNGNGNGIPAVKNGSATVGRGATGKKASTRASVLEQARKVSAPANRIPSSQFIIRPVKIPEGMASSYWGVLPAQQIITM